MIEDMIFLVLGTQPVLSLAEIAAVLGRDLDYASATGQIVRLPKPQYLTADQLQERLAGIVKVGHIVGEIAGVDESEMADLIAAFVHTGRPGKISFGISVYDGGDSGRTAQLKKRLQAIGLEVKRRVKEAGVSVRYVSSRAQALSAVIVTENHLLESGGEFVLIGTPQGIVVGQTETVQGYKAWSKRDYGRPARDARSGMLPPKLARIMINLSGANSSNAVLLDPFCGSGTIPMEASLMGFQNVIGSDISKKAVQDTVENLRHVLGEKQELPRVFQSSAEDLLQHLAKPVDVIVTETYLGPPSPGRQTPAAWQRTIAELLELYQKSFQTLYQILKPGGTAVVAFPAFVKNNRLEFVPIAEKLKQIGFQIQSPLPSSAPKIFQELTPSGGLLYKRPDAHVAREILVLKK